VNTVNLFHAPHFFGQDSASWLFSTCLRGQATLKRFWDFFLTRTTLEQATHKWAKQAHLWGSANSRAGRLLAAGFQEWGGGRVRGGRRRQTRRQWGGRLNGGGGGEGARGGGDTFSNTSGKRTGGGLPRRPVLGGGSNYTSLLALLRTVRWVLIENSVLVPLSAIMQSHSNYYPYFPGG